MASVLLGALLVLAGCGGEAAEDAPAEPESPDTTEALDGIQLILAIDQLAYAPGETIRMELVLVNRLDRPRTLPFATAQRVDARIVDEGGEELRRWSADQLFAQVLGEESLAPGDEGRRWTLELPAPDVPGTYRLIGVITATAAPLEASLPLEVR